MRPTRRRNPSRETARQLRLAALRSWEIGETLDEVAERLRVRPSWLYVALKEDIATAQRHFGPGVTADDVTRATAPEIGLTRDRIPYPGARAFVGYCIRRLYARQADASARARAKKRGPAVPDREAFIARSAGGYVNGAYVPPGGTT